MWPHVNISSVSLFLSLETPRPPTVPTRESGKSPLSLASALWVFLLFGNKEQVCYPCFLWLSGKICGACTGSQDNIQQWHWKHHPSAVPLVHPVEVPKVGGSDSQVEGLEMSCHGFWLLVLSSTAWLWKWRLCSTLQMCRNYVSNLQQCWETVFKIIKWMNLQQQSESNPWHDQSSDLSSLAGWSTAKQFWTAVVTNCLWVISE